MPYGGHNGAFCKGCGGHVSEVGRLSARYKCRDCGWGHMNANAEQLAARSGPYYDAWVRRMVMVGRRLLVDLASREN